MTKTQLKVLKKYAPELLKPEPKWILELHRELEEMRQEQAIEEFKKRYKPSEKTLEGIARWLERNTKRVDKLLKDGLDYSDILRLALNTTKLKRLGL